MKGYLFSTDALIAFVIILLAATALWSTTQEKNYSPTSLDKMQNKEMTALYFNYPTDTPNNTLLSQKCVNITHYQLTSAGPPIVQNFSQKTVCEAGQ